MSVAAFTKRLLFGRRDQIAQTVYGTLIVMGAITAGSGAHAEPAELAAIVFATVLVLWIAHVYAHGLGESIEQGRRLDRAEFVSVAHRESAHFVAALGPIAALLLGAVGLLRESRAIWLALGLGLATLVVQGVRYARLEHVGGLGMVLAVAVNVLLGLVILALKLLVAH